MAPTTCDHIDHRTSLDGWAPLAAHSEQLDGAETQQAMLIAAVDDGVADPGNRSPVQTDAWTGDRAGSVSLHHDLRLTWLCRSLGAAAHRYLERLGHDISGLRLSVTRAWGAISRPGQALPARTHHDADLIAVYHVAAAPGSGAVRFINTSRGLHSEVAATPGRLTIFPSRQRHEMLMNGADPHQFSIWFEIAIDRCRGDRPCGGSRSSSASARRLPDPRRIRPNSVPEMVDLESLRLNTSCQPDDETPINIVPGLPPDPATWRHFRLAADRLRRTLEEVGVDTLDAAVSTPSVSWRRTDNRTLYGTAPTDLQVYVRADDGETHCVIELEGDTMPMPLRRGVPTLVNGRRRHRVVGEGVVMRFGADVPGANEPELVAAIEDVFVLHVLQGGNLVTGSRSGGHRHRGNLFPVG